MARRDLQKRLTELEMKAAAGDGLDWVPFENGLRRLFGEPEIPHTPEPGRRVGKYEDWVRAEAVRRNEGRTDPIRDE